MGLMRSWVTSANGARGAFPLNNLPYGVFSTGGDRRCGVAIGDRIVDVSTLALASVAPETFKSGSWNAFMALGPDIWAAFRAELQARLQEGAAPFDLVPMAGATLHLPFTVAEFTDFYAGRHHATNVGTMFRGAENALPPNWLHMPIGYNGRASSVVVSGHDVRRPWGQIKGPEDTAPRFAPSARFDFELELGAIVGQPSNGPLGVAEADAGIFGYVLLNDWSARDIQAWEYQPLGPFQAKAAATTISPWIIPKAALEPFRVAPPARDVPLLPYLTEPAPMLYDIDLEVTLAPEGQAATTITRTSYAGMYYSAAQQIAHHTSSGCPMRVGDLLGSGTISGPEKESRGSMLELSWGGKEPVTLEAGAERAFLEDGDTVTLRGWAQGEGYRIGFGDCTGRILPALKDPYKR